jgi:hypothetical protein
MGMLALDNIDAVLGGRTAPSLVTYPRISESIFGTRSKYLIQTPKVSELLLSVAPDVEGLVNPVLNKIVALLTLTELSLLAEKAVLHLAFLSS